MSCAIRRASSNSPSARLGLTPVTATARSPNAKAAALATTELSTPAEKATAQLGNRSQILQEPVP